MTLSIRFPSILWTFCFSSALGLVFFCDKDLMRWIMMHNQHWPVLYKTARWMSFFGQGHFYIIPAVLILFLPYFLAKYRLRGWQKKVYERMVSWREKAFFFLSIYLTSSLGATVLKIIFGRPRPGSSMLEGEDVWRFFTFNGHWHSLPSGHAQDAFLFALIFGSFFPKGRFLFFIWPLMVGLSRVYLTKHFLGDILMGFSIAWVFYGVMRSESIQMLLKEKIPLTSK